MYWMLIISMMNLLDEYLHASNKGVGMVFLFKDFLMLEICCNIILSQKCGNGTHFSSTQYKCVLLVLCSWFNSNIYCLYIMYC